MYKMIKPIWPYLILIAIYTYPTISQGASCDLFESVISKHLVDEEGTPQVAIKPVEEKSPLIAQDGTPSLKVVPKQDPPALTVEDGTKSLSNDKVISNETSWGKSPSGNPRLNKSVAEMRPTHSDLVSLSKKAKDPTSKFSPKNRFDELYTTSWAGRKAKKPAGYNFGPDDREIIVKLKSKDLFAKEIKANLGKNPDEIIKAGIGKDLPEQYFTFLKEGGNSRAYLTHTNPLPSNIVPGSKEHLKWAIENGENLVVKKVPKKINADDLNSEKINDLINLNARDDLMNQVLDDLAMDATLNGKPFVRVAKTDFIKGTQEFVNGPSAAELRAAQELIERGPGAESLKGVKMSLEEAKELLTKAGFVKNGQIDLERLNNNLNALEQFYKDGHDIARSVGNKYFGDSVLSNKYRPIAEEKILNNAENALVNPQANGARKNIDLETKPAKLSSGNRQQNDPHLRDLANANPGIAQPKINPAPEQVELEGFDASKNGVVGFDFNHGVNQAWDAKNQMFVIFDR